MRKWFYAGAVVGGMISGTVLAITYAQPVGAVAPSASSHRCAAGPSVSSLFGPGVAPGVTNQMVQVEVGQEDVDRPGELITQSDAPLTGDYDADLAVLRRHFSVDMARHPERYS